MTIPDVVGHKFLGLAEEWRRSRPPSSRMKDLAAVSAYQEIIKMGMPVVPCIIREFVEGRIDHWFWALCKITGQDPVQPAHRGILSLMADSWCRWWRDPQTGTTVQITKGQRGTKE